MVYVFLAFWVVLGLAVFFVAMRRGGARDPSAHAGAGAESAVIQRLSTLGVLLLVAFGLAVPALVVAANVEHKSSSAIGGVHLSANETKGRELFARSCVFCHALAAVKSYGRFGPNLDVHVGYDVSTYAGRKALVYSAVVEGRARGRGDMPALLYQGKEAEDVAEFVAAVAGH